MGRLATELAALRAIAADGGTVAGDLRVDGTLTAGAAGTIEFGANGDANLYRAGPDYLGTDGKIGVSLDIECWANSKGLVLHDRTNDSPYRLKVTSGVLGIEAVA